MWSSKLSFVFMLCDGNDDGLIIFSEFLRFLHVIQNCMPDETKKIMFYAIDFNFNQ